MFYICIQYLHDARGRRTRPAHQPESSRKAPGGGSQPRGREQSNACGQVERTNETQQAGEDEKDNTISPYEAPRVQALYPRSPRITAERP